MKKDRLKKGLLFIIVLAAIGMVLFFTLQEPTKSKDLSEVMRSWLRNLGVEIGYETLRHDIHLLEYFIVGMSLMIFFNFIK